MQGRVIIDVTRALASNEW